MSIKIYISAGHGGVDGGTGTTLNNVPILEKSVNLDIATAVRDYLADYDVETEMKRVDDTRVTLAEMIPKINEYQPDLAIDIHHNAGKGDGFEAFYQTHANVTYRSLTAAMYIEDSVKKIGQNSRGLKTRFNEVGLDYYGFLRDVKYPALIIECAFMDNSTDFSIVDTLEERKRYGEAIAEGIVQYFKLTPKSTPIYRVQVGAFRNKQYADNFLTKINNLLKEENLTAYITESEE